MCRWYLHPEELRLHVECSASCRRNKHSRTCRTVYTISEDLSVLAEIAVIDPPQARILRTR